MRGGFVSAIAARKRQSMACTSVIAASKVVDAYNWNATEAAGIERMGCLALSSIGFGSASGRCAAIPKILSSNITVVEESESAKDGRRVSRHFLPTWERGHPQS